MKNKAYGHQSRRYKNRSIRPITQSSLPDGSDGIKRGDAENIYYRVDRPDYGSEVWTLRVWSDRAISIPDLTLNSSVTGKPLAVVAAGSLDLPRTVEFKALSLPGTVALSEKPATDVTLNVIHPPTVMRWVGPRAAPPGPKVKLASFG